VQVYKNVQGIVQKNFDLTHLTTNHAATDMSKTFAKLRDKLSLTSPYSVSIGRKSRHEIKDLNDKGREMMEKAAQGDVQTEETEMERAELDDIIVELL
jgi:hypothetical protein